MRPSHETCRSPAPACAFGNVRRTTPEIVLIRDVIVAARVSLKTATARGCGRGTASAGATGVAKPSVRLSVKSRSPEDGTFRSSTALTTQRQRPSTSGVPSAFVPDHSNGYVPGAAGPLNVKRETPSGPSRLTVTFDWRTTLYARCWRSETPSPFGESTASAGCGR